MANPAPVVDATDQDFQAVVLDVSNTTPVLVDFWAPWCGPCKVIGPLLEKLAQEMNGRFRLVKVNMDENPMLAQALMIRSIPAVKLFVNGQIKDEFLGAYPEPEVRRFLETNLPTVAVNDAVSGLQLWSQGRHEDAAKVFRAILQKEPEDAVALIGMATYQLHQGDLAAARAQAQKISELDLEKVPDAKSIRRELAALQGRIYLTEQVQPAAQAPSAAPENPEAAAAFTRSCTLALQGNHEEALAGFLAQVKKDRKFREDGGRKGMLAVFALLPADSRLADDFRAKLSAILFS